LANQPFFEGMSEEMVQHSSFSARVRPESVEVVGA